MWCRLGDINIWSNNAPDVALGSWVNGGPILYPKVLGLNKSYINPKVK